LGGRRFGFRGCLFLGEVLLDSLGDFVDGCFFAELFDVLIAGDGGKADLGGHLAVHADDGGDLLFGEEEDLQHEVVALVGAAGEARLAHEDEAGDQDGFERDAGAEQGEGRWVEARYAWDAEGIGEHPEEEDAKMHEHEAQTADESGDGVAGALVWGAAGEEFLLMFQDRVDVFLDLVGRFQVGGPLLAG